MPVNTEHSDYKNNKYFWEKCRDAVEGQESVHDKTIQYLPKLEGQTSTEYINYLKRALFYNGTQRTVDAMTGLLFRKDPKIEISDSFKPWLKNVDGNGNNLQTFVEKVADDVMTVGRIGILVEHPVKTEEVRTKYDSERLGMRPFLTPYKAENIINWKFTVVNNVKVLTMVVLKEYHFEAGDDEFTHRSVVKYRVLDLFENKYRQRLFVETENGFVQEGEDIYPVIKGRNFNFIPFVLISSKDCDFDVVKPPILDLVNVNFSHYKTVADLEHGSHFTGLPTVVITGYNKKDNESLKIGSTSAWILPDPEADAKYLEFTGQGLAALENRLISKEKAMAALGARLLADEKAAAETAETNIIKRSGENSVLSSMAKSISYGIQSALQIMVEWSGSTEEVIFEINRDFLPVKMDSQMLTALVKAWQSSAISYSEFVRNLQEGEIIDSEKTAEDLQNEILEEGPKGLGGFSEENLNNSDSQNVQ